MFDCLIQVMRDLDHMVGLQESCPHISLHFNVAFLVFLTEKHLLVSTSYSHAGIDVVRKLK